MFEKIMKNINKIIFIASIVAAALVTYDIVKYFDQDFSDYYVISFIAELLVIISGVVVSCFYGKNKQLDEKTLCLPLVLFFTGMSMTHVYSLFGSSASFRNVIVLALYAAIIIVYLVSLVNKKVNTALLVLLLVFGCIQLAGVFAGSYLAIAYLLTTGVLSVQIYLNNKGENLNE